METSDGKRVGLSKVAAREGIGMVTLSRYIDDDGYIDDHEVTYITHITVLEWLLREWF